MPKSAARAQKPARPVGGRGDGAMTRATRTPTAYGYIWRSPAPRRNKRSAAEDARASWTTHDYTRSAA